jgi:hypothetical protein
LANTEAAVKATEESLAKLRASAAKLKQLVSAREKEAASKQPSPGAGKVVEPDQAAGN